MRIVNICLGFILAAASFMAAVSGLADERPNIILFVTDDLSPDAGCYGVESIKTPHIDALAKDGLRFDQAFCTTASCSASRSVILTGIHNHANAHYGHEHAYHHFSSYGDIKSLPVRLTEAGYRTARIGKYHVAPEAVYKFETVLPGNPRNAVQMANASREFIAADDERPFFLYFCTSDPHRSGGSVEGDPYKADPFGNKPESYPGVTLESFDPKDVKVHSFLPDTPTCRHELAQYYQSVSRIDQGLGKLVQILKAAGQYDNSIIIFTSDHGIAFPGAKTTLYDGGMRIPMIVRAPKCQQRGGSTEAMVSLLDMTPTILDFAGVWQEPDPKKKEKYAIQGRSFADVVATGKATDRDEVYASHTFHEITMYYPMRVVRTRRYKLIWNIAYPLPYPFASDLWEAPTWQDIYQQGADALYGKRTVKAYIHRPQFELYDLQADPDEIHNLADNQEHQELLQSLKTKLKAFQKQTDDPWILKWDYE